MLIVVTLILGVFEKDVPNAYFHFAIFSSALALLYHRSLITQYLTGWDIHLEYYVSSSVLINSYWDQSFPFTLNSMLPISIGIPILSEISGINIIWVYKSVSPILFSMVPTVLYHVYKYLFNKKIAFCSAFLFISFYAFFTEMLALVRQQIAMLIFALILLIIANNELLNNKKLLLINIFSIMLVFSHYLIFYILIFLFTVMIIKSKSNLFSIFSYFTLIVLSFIWYVYISQGFVYDSTSNFISNLLSNLHSEFFSTNARDPSISYVLGRLPTLTIFRYFTAFYQYVVIILLLFGFAYLNIYHKIKNTDFKKISIGSFLLLIICLIVPYLSLVNMERLFLIALMPLSPFCIFGGILFLKLIKKLLRIQNKLENIKLISILLLTPYLLLNSGFVYEVAHDPPSSISFDQTIDYPRFNNYEYSSAQWLLIYKSSIPIYADLYRVLLIMGLDYFSANQITSSGVVSQSYVFLGTTNIKYSRVLISIYEEGKTTRTYVSYSPYCDFRNYAYDNGGSKICF
ncbi:MAG: DUF2206 domain-containing protein [Candidatus Methanosuratincola petrocarbonis]